MRIAAISDVHGNLPALDTVLADIATQGVDVVVNLGDLLSGAVQPRETAERLMELDVLTVAGNHERQLLTLPREGMGGSDRLAHDSIDDRHRAWMARLPLPLVPAEGVLAFHGSPTDDLVHLLETVDPDGARPATEAEVLDRLGPFAGVPCCCAATPTCSARCGCPPARWCSTRAASGGRPTATTPRIRTWWRRAPRSAVRDRRRRERQLGLRVPRR